MDKPAKRTHRFYFTMMLVVPTVFGLLMKILDGTVGFFVMFFAILRWSTLILVIMAVANHYKSKPKPDFRAVLPTKAGQAPLSTRAGFPLLGGVMGFAVAYLTRPVLPITGEKIPLYLLLEPAEPMFAGLKSDFMTHMIVTTVIGIIAGMVLVRVLASLNRA